jgi:hypothetical protein
VGLGESRLHDAGLPQGGAGLVELALLGQGDAEVGEGLGVAWLQAEGAAEAGGGVGELALPLAGGAEEAPAFGVAGIGFQGLAVELLGSRQVAALVAVAGPLERFSDGGHGTHPLRADDGQARTGLHCTARRTGWKGQESVPQGVKHG